jgi:hypothetical protein
VCAAEYNPKGAAHSLKNATLSFHVAATSLEEHCVLRSTLLFSIIFQRRKVRLLRARPYCDVQKTQGPPFEGEILLLRMWRDVAVT